MTYSLRAYNPLVQGAGFVGDITSLAQNWKRERTYTGGPWQGTFTIRGNKDLLEDWFYQGLNRHIEERVGGLKTWEGFVWEMNLFAYDQLQSPRLGQRGTRMRRSLEDMYNRVKVNYTDPGTETTGDTGWVQDTTSIDLYGTKELIMFEETDSASALNMANTILAESAGAEPQLVGIERSITEARLEVTLAGYVTTAQYIYTTTADGSTVTVADWVEDLLAELPLISTLAIAANDHSIEKTVTEPTRIWAQLEQLLFYKNSDDQIYNLVFNNYRQASYKVINPEPIGYLWNGAFVTKAYESLENNPRLMQPGIYRDILRHAKMPSARWSATSYLQGPADFLLESIEVDQENALIPRLRSSDDEEKYRSWTPPNENEAPPDPDNPNPGG